MSRRAVPSSSAIPRHSYFLAFMRISHRIALSLPRLLGSGGLERFSLARAGQSRASSPGIPRPLRPAPRQREKWGSIFEKTFCSSTKREKIEATSFSATMPFLLYFRVFLTNDAHISAYIIQTETSSDVICAGPGLQAGTCICFQTSSS